MNPKISIILPVYNAEKYIKETLDSVLSQTFHDFEVVAVNDGSTDSSLGILTSYRERDGRIKVIDKPNTGVSDTRNVAIKAAEGEYLAFLDSDDIYAPEYLERMYLAALEKRADVVVCDYVTFRGDAPTFDSNERAEATEVSIRELLDTGLMTSMCVKLVSKNVITDNDITFDANIKYSEDLFYSWKVCLASERTCRIKDHLYGYRLTGTGATSKYHDGIYYQYGKAFKDITAFAYDVDKAYEVDNINISFVRGLPAFLLMTARKRCSLREKKRDIKAILSDERISDALCKSIDSVVCNERDRRMYLDAKNGKAQRLLLRGYYMHFKGKMAALLKRR